METSRLSVNINRETADALKQMAKERGISVTEVVRRAVAITKFVEDETRRGHRIQVVGQNGDNARELMVV